MRIFVSSSFEDLQDHRASAIRVLRQLGHEVIAMEDMTAGSLAPLAKFSKWWTAVKLMSAFSPGATAIRRKPGSGRQSSREPRQARPRSRNTNTCTLSSADCQSWPFCSTNVGRGHRNSWMDSTRRGPARSRTPKGYESSGSRSSRSASCRGSRPRPTSRRGSARPSPRRALQTSSICRRRQLCRLVPAGRRQFGRAGHHPSHITAGDHQRALKIDLATDWWSTRLYLIASLAQRLTQARRILVADTSAQPQATNPKPRRAHCRRCRKSASSASSRPPPSFRYRRKIARTSCLRG